MSTKWLHVIFISIAVLLFTSSAYTVFGVVRMRNGRTIFSSLKLQALALLPELIFKTGFPESSDRELQGEKEGRINILLLGIGGKGHEGTYLADTVMLASLFPGQESVGLLSIPRDFVIPIPGLGWRKVNNLTAIGEFREAGFGGEYARQILEKIFDEKIHYVVRVDFAGFEKFIDVLGGLEVDVENPLVDYHYPIAGQEGAPLSERYEILRIPQGRQQFNGDLALKYVRSRYALPPEHSDFARMKRQQKMIEAIREKFEAMKGGEVSQLFALLNIFEENVSTNLKPWEMYRFWQVVKGISQERVIAYVLEPGPSSLVKANSGLDGAFIIEPIKDDFSEIRALVDNFLVSGKSIISGKSENRGVRIALYNGTGITGLAAKTAEKLKDEGFTITDIGNAPSRDYEKTVIYLLQEDFSQEAVGYLKDALDANIAQTFPEALRKTVSSNPNLVIVLGKRNTK